MRIFNAIRERSVFKKLDKDVPMADLLAAMFHGMSATIYAIYVFWAIVALVFGIPNLIAANGDVWQNVFSALCLVIAAPACFGATFWPSFARLEALAGSSFIGLIVLYIGTLISNVITHTGSASWADVVIISSVLVMPICRTIIVLVLLIRQAAKEKSERAERDAQLRAEMVGEIREIRERLDTDGAY